MDVNYLNLSIIIKKIFFSMFIYFWEKETQCEWERGRERGRHRIRSRLQGPTCQHRAWHGLKLMGHEIMTWAEVRRWTDWATQALLDFFLNFIYLFWKRESMNEGRAEREGDRESHAGSALPLWNLIQGSNRWTGRPWPKPKSRVGQSTEPPRHPNLWFLLLTCSIKILYQIKYCTFNK